MTVSHNVHLERRAVPRPADVLELAKPVTWFPPMWAYACGVVSSGVALRERGGLLLLGVVLAGPLVCATSQVINDWFDRHVDAINEPHRPIPSGRIPGRWGLWLGIAGTVASLGAGALLGRWGLLATALGLLLAWGYSMPPFRFKQNGWIGNLAVGLSYEGLAWVTGAAVMLGSVAPRPGILFLALMYSLGAHGMLTLNDFKAIAGDTRMGVRSLPVQLGPVRAAQVASATILLPQLAVIAALVAWERPLAAAAIGALCVVQVLMMRRFVAQPVERALWYSALGVPFSVLGMMVAAAAVRGLA